MASSQIGFRGLIPIAVLFILGLASCQGSVQGRTVAGIVKHEDQPVPGAVVRLQTTEIHTLTGPDRRIQPPGPWPGGPREHHSLVRGLLYRRAQGCHAGSDQMEIILEKHPDSDHPDYDWLPAGSGAGEGENQGCGQCHSSAGTDLSHSLPYDQSIQDAHSRSALNPRFLSTYLGTDLDGNQSPLTRFNYAKAYGTYPLKPDLSQPYYGPGYKLDFPGSAGNCAACHAPAAAINDPYGVDPSLLSGVGAEGVTCDFCHKVWDVELDPSSGLPKDNAPGVLSFSFRRPPPGRQFFAGPFDDVAPGEDTYSPLQRESQYCAACHYGTFWDTVVYNSFGEWLASPYSDPDTGQSCQNCHMPTGEADYFALPEQGGLIRPAETISSHLMPGAADLDLLQNAVSLSAEALVEGERLIVQVSILNDQTGHHVPTDSPLRQMILLIEARDAAGQALPQLDGPVVPDWGGIGSPEGGYYGGLPGQGYAKILTEIWTQHSPSAAYWNPTRVQSDNRIPALETDTTRFSFALPCSPEDPELQVQVRLIYRRAFKELMDQKGWLTPDILMEERLLIVP